jgi:hypothetical protein
MPQLTCNLIGGTKLLLPYNENKTDTFKHCITLVQSGLASTCIGAFILTYHNHDTQQEITCHSDTINEIEQAHLVAYIKSNTQPSIQCLPKTLKIQRLSGEEIHVDYLSSESLQGFFEAIEYKGGLSPITIQITFHDRENPELCHEVLANTASLYTQSQIALDRDIAMLQDSDLYPFRNHVQPIPNSNRAVIQSQDMHAILVTTRNSLLNVPSYYRCATSISMQDWKEMGTEQGKIIFNRTSQTLAQTLAQALCDQITLNQQAKPSIETVEALTEILEEAIISSAPNQTWVAKIQTLFQNDPITLSDINIEAVLKRCREHESINLRCTKFGLALADFGQTEIKILEHLGFTFNIEETIQTVSKHVQTIYDLAQTNPLTENIQVCIVNTLHALNIDINNTQADTIVKIAKEEDQEKAKRKISLFLGPLCCTSVNNYFYETTHDIYIRKDLGGTVTGMLHIILAQQLKSWEIKLWKIMQHVKKKEFTQLLQLVLPHRLLDPTELKSFLPRLIEQCETEPRFKCKMRLVIACLVQAILLFLLITALCAAYMSPSLITFIIIISQPVYGSNSLLVLSMIGTVILAPGLYYFCGMAIVILEQYSRSFRMFDGIFIQTKSLLTKLEKTTNINQYVNLQKDRANQILNGLIIFLLLTMIPMPLVHYIVITAFSPIYTYLHLPLITYTPLLPYGAYYILLACVSYGVGNILENNTGFVFTSCICGVMGCHILTATLLAVAAAISATIPFSTLATLPVSAMPSSPLFSVFSLCLCAILMSLAAKGILMKSRYEPLFNPATNSNAFMPMALNDLFILPMFEPVEIKLSSFLGFS